ncbi:hypothetical protein [Patulibacter minatonensis]|uniref:hypothetical protein n=1 Tax=Patulibacter minatonensis TaxID=298163 RepID=UPI00047BD030|nr:hypothetical protein [Patulibacter minatonensis]
MVPDGAAADANASRNARRERGRRPRWASCRDALWSLTDPHLAPGARVAVVGAGNGDDLPLGRIAHRASVVTLLDIDDAAAAEAVRRVRRGLRRRIRVVQHDVTRGAVDRVVHAASHEGAVGAPAARGAAVGPRSGPATTGDGGTRLPGGPYDLVIGDLLYSQLLYPALLDAGVPADRRRATIAREGGPLTAGVVAVLHASAPVVVHVHDPACWGNGYAQPVELRDVLDAADDDPGEALRLAARAKGPREADPRPALAEAGVPVLSTALWHWPFVDGVDYLVVGTVAGAPRSAGA